MVFFGEDYTSHHPTQVPLFILIQASGPNVSYIKFRPSTPCNLAWLVRTPLEAEAYRTRQAVVTSGTVQTCCWGLSDSVLMYRPAWLAAWQSFSYKWGSCTLGGIAYVYV